MPFLGREALLKQKATGVNRQMAIFVLQDPEPVLWGSEPILRDGEVVGYTTSGSYGHTVGGGIGMGYIKSASRVTPEFIQSGTYQINVSGRLCPATVHLRPPYDPERKRILG